MYHPLDDLLYEVNRVAKAPTVEDLRESVTRNLIDVYKKVDSPSLLQGDVHHYEQSDSSSFKLPKYCILPLNLIAGRMQQESFDEMGKYIGYARVNQMGHPVNFKHSGDKIWITGGFGSYARLSNPPQYYSNLPLTLSYWRIPLDDAGVPLVDDRIWSAAKYYCWAEEALIGLHGKNTQSFAGLPFQVDERKAAAAIDEARAFCNKLTPNNWRAFFEKK